MLSRNSVPYSLNLIGFENEGLITQNNANTTRIIQNKESILSGLETGYSSYSDGNNVRGSHRRTYQKSSKNRHRKLMNRTSARMVNSDGVNENSIPEENSTPEETFTYDDVPGELLFCHVCNIMVSSSQEFAAHLQDVTHDDMMTCLENQFQEEAEELRRKGKAKYERDFNELGRANVKIKCHCVMCDADIPELLSKHRRSESHQTLRKYLHPECDVCVTKFKTRIEWTRHLLTPTHLMKIAATNVHRDTSQNFEYRADELEPVGNVDSGLVKEEKEEEQTEQNNADIRDQINFFCKEEEEEEQTEQNNADIRDQINFFSKVKEEQEEDEEEEQNIESAEGEGSRVCSGINEYCNVVGGDSRSSDHSGRF
ncbi:zinc finger protein on ecdysone puffs-like [Anabrus simplex]|uniref:zinc finger protein on ecdysone puffs-like n=1 Tax=Anabrus simplex TaxID=316456 RepID=UPI0035A29EDD